MVNIPDTLKNIIGNRTFQIDTVVMSDSQVFIYDDAVLKVERQNEESGQRTYHDEVAGR